MFPVFEARELTEDRVLQASTLPGEERHVWQQYLLQAVGPPTGRGGRSCWKWQTTISINSKLSMLTTSSQPPYSPSPKQMKKKTTTQKNTQPNSMRFRGRPYLSLDQQATQTEAAAELWYSAVTAIHTTTKLS